jgi:hypothetical protein
VTTPFTPVPPTRVTGEGDPAGDMDSTSEELAAMGGSSNVLDTSFSGGADATGAKDSTAAFSAALASGYAIIPAGTYKIAGNLTATPPVRIIGAGRSLVTISFYGSGDCLRINTTGSSSGFGVADLRGFTIDGTNASAGAAGLHMGDCFAPHIDDVAVNNFQGSGSKGAWFDNQYNFMEQLTGRIYARANTSNVVFDSSANPSGTAGASFDRAIFVIFLDQDGVGDGVTWQNGAFIYDGHVGIRGNFQPGTSQYSALKFVASPALSFTATHASPCVFTASGSYYGDGQEVTLAGGSLPGGFSAQTYFVVAASGDTFELAATLGGTAINSTGTGSGTVTAVPMAAVNDSVFNTGVECTATGPGTTFPYTIDFGANSGVQGAGNQIWDCTGIMDFGANAAFASARNPRFAFRYDGPVYGDPGLQRSMALGRQPVNDTSGLTSGSTINTKFTALIRVSAASNITGVILEGYDPDDWREVTILNIGTGSVTFAAAGTSNVADGTADVIAPGTAATFHWDVDESLWFRAYPGYVPGQSLCAPSVYAPSSRVTVAVTSTTLAAFAGSGAASTVAAASNGGEISAIATWSSPSAGVLDVVNGTLFPAAGGEVTVAASGSTTAVVTYTGVSGNSLTGCAYVSGSATGTVSTGGAVTLTSSPILTNSFIAPASGAVVVDLDYAILCAAGGDETTLALTAAGTVTPVVGYVVSDTTGSGLMDKRARFPLAPGTLTPGTSYQLQLVGATAAASSTIYAYGNTATAQGSVGAPVTMTVQAV